MLFLLIIILIKVRHMWEGSPAEETIMKELTQENGEVFPEKYGKINKIVFIRNGHMETDVKS